MKKSKEVDDYIEEFPDHIRKRLNQMREIITENAPEAEEGFSYGMPAYKSDKKPLVYFAGFKGHIGFYATPSGHSQFAKELEGYKQGKGSVQFPLTQPLPLKLIAEIVKFRIKENAQKAARP